MRVKYAAEEQARLAAMTPRQRLIHRILGALGMIALLAAEPILEAAFLRPETSRLLVVVLAYVWIEDDDGALALVNLAAVDRGYARAREYGDIPTRWGALLAEAQATARAAGAGLWGACAD